MATGLQYKENLTLISGGYTGEGIGSNGVTQDWTDVSTLSGTSTVTYYYHDSYAASDSNSTLVEVTITDSWSASIDDLNNITITVSSTLDSITRTIVGSPGTYYVNIFVRRTSGGSLLWSASNLDTSVNASYISTPVNLGSSSFTLAPGDTTNVQGTVYYRSNTTGYDDQDPPSKFVDEFWMGINFRNTLPTPTTYTVTYDANGGSGAPSAQTTTTAQSSASFTVSSTEPTWGNYEFLGWSTTQYSDSRTESDVEYVGGDTITLTSSSPSVTLYAVWRMDYRPHAIYNSGSWYSHNRSGGTCHVLTSTSGPTYTELRTIGGESDQLGNPPSTYHDSKWYNSHRLGLE